MERSFDTIIKISSVSMELIVEQTNKGITSYKTLTPETFAKCVLDSRYDDKIHPTGFLPENCFAATLVG